MTTWLLGQAALTAQRVANDAFAAADAKRSQYSVLAALDELGPASQVELGRRCGYDRSDMVAILNDLESDQFVARDHDVADRRRNVVSITARGRRRLHKLDGVAAAIQDEVLAPLSERDRRQLTTLLQRIVDHRSSPSDP